MVRLGWVPGESWGVNRHIAWYTSPYPWSRTVRWCLAVGLACGDQRRRTGSDSTLEAHRDDALYKYMFILLYFDLGGGGCPGRVCSIITGYSSFLSFYLRVSAYIRLKAMFRGASFDVQFALLVARHLYFLFFVIIVLFHLANKICSVL